MTMAALRPLNIATIDETSVESVHPDACVRPRSNLASGDRGSCEPAGDAALVRPTWAVQGRWFLVLATEVVARDVVGGIERNCVHTVGAVVPQVGEDRDIDELLVQHALDSGWW